MPQNFYDCRRKWPRVIAHALLLEALLIQILPANAARPVIVNTTITNTLTRYLTNVIEVSIPNNVFVDVFRTNRVRRDVTNLIDLYQTNIVLQYRTNVLTADRYVTNLVTTWHTNVKTLTLTNWENLVLLRTNWVRQPVTNFVEFTRTNFVMLTVTNWIPVTVTRTNFVSPPSTRPAEIAQPVTAAAPVPILATTTTPAPKAEPLPTAPAADLGRGLELDLTHVGAPTRPGQFPIRLVLLSASGAILPVSEWRVEKTGGGGLMVGAKPEFSTDLPAGIYRIAARVRSDDGTTRNVSGDTEIKNDARALRTPARVVPGR